MFYSPETSTCTASWWNFGEMLISGFYPGGSEIAQPLDHGGFAEAIVA